jgi:hypothetical protein
MVNRNPAFRLSEKIFDIGEVTNLSPAQLAVKWQLWVRSSDYLKMVNAQMPTLDPTYSGTTNGTFVLAGATGPPIALIPSPRLGQTSCS